MNPRLIRFGLGLIALSLFALWIPKYQIGQYNDEAVHILGAASLLQGRYVDLAVPGEPALNAPFPGYPFLLAPFVAVLHSHWEILKWLSLIFMWLAGWLALRASRDFLSLEGDLWFLALFWLNPLTVEMSGLVLAESAFLCGVFGCFLCARTLLKDETPAVYWILGALLTLTVLMRPQGAALLAGIAAVFVAARRPRALVLLAAPAAAIAAVLIRNWHLTKQAAGYITSWQQIGAPLLRSPGGLALQAVWNLEVICRAVTASSADAFPAAGWISGIVLVAVLGFAAFRTDWRRSFDSFSPLGLGFGAFAVFYLAIQLLWPAAQERYFLPLIPLLWIWVLGTLKKGPVPRALFLLFAILAGCYAIQDIRQGILPPRQSVPRETYDFIARTVPGGARFFACRNSDLYLYTGRQAMPFLAARDLEEFRHQLDVRGLDFILYEPLPFQFVRTGQALDPGRLWQESPGWLEASGRFPRLLRNFAEGTQVYQVPHDPAFQKAYSIYEDAMRQLKAGNGENALIKLRQSLAVYPGFAHALRAYGATLALQGGSLEEAKANLERAVLIEPRSEAAWQVLSLVYERLGKREEASQARRRAADLHH